MIGGATPFSTIVAVMRFMAKKRKRGHDYSVLLVLFLDSLSLSSLASLFAQRKILISLQDGITRKNSCSGNRSSVHLVLMIETVSFRNR